MCTTICTTAKAMMTSAVVVLVGNHARHHQPERNRGEDDRQDEAGHVRSRSVAVARAVVAVMVVVVCA